MTKNPQGTKWQITINNTADHGFDREYIKSQLGKLKPVIYWCIADEIGEEGQTPHTHIYTVFSSAVRFSTLRNLFKSTVEPERFVAHLERAVASHKANRDYVAKEGKWADYEGKHGTKIEDSFEEWGEMPIEFSAGNGRCQESVVLNRITSGASNADILMEFPNYLRAMRDVEYARQTLKADENRDKWRDLEVIYIWGVTGAGKTRYVMDDFGYSNVYSVNNYKHPFDGYTGEEVMLFDEFNSGLRIQDMNNYLGGYPLALPARYSNKQACYSKVFIISNLDLSEQYRGEQLQQPEVWSAFLRRIHKVMYFGADGTRQEWNTKDYLEYRKSVEYKGYVKSGRDELWEEMPIDTVLPFDDWTGEVMT